MLRIAHVGLSRNQPELRMNHRRVSGTFTLGAHLPETGDREQDDLRIHFAKVRVADAESLRDPRAKVLDRDVGARRQPAREVGAAGHTEIDTHIALAGILLMEVTADAADVRAPVA